MINELSSRFPDEGGLYVWAKEAFGDFHGFVAGWTYWIYTVFYFPGPVAGQRVDERLCFWGKGLQRSRRTAHFCWWVSLGLLFVGGGAEHHWLEYRQVAAERGGVATYLPLLMLVGIAALVYFKHGSATHFTWANMMPTWNWDTVNFWSQIAFAFTGLELVSAMSEEVRDPRRTLPRAVFGAGAHDCFMYIVGTFAVLGACACRRSRPEKRCVPRNHARLVGAANSDSWGSWRLCWFPSGMRAESAAPWRALRGCPFVVGIDRYLPATFGKIHSKWKTPYVSILVQAGSLELFCCSARSQRDRPGCLSNPH